MKPAVRIIPTPIGDLKVIAGENGIEVAMFTDVIENCRGELRASLLEGVNTAKNQHIDLLVEELGKYFAGELKEFTVQLNFTHGSDFAKSVWGELCRIPYGERISYKTEAERLSRAKAFRAVANANGRNPIVIVVPCHRVVASGGALGGYSAGLWRKKFLLNLEDNSKI